MEKNPKGRTDIDYRAMANKLGIAGQQACDRAMAVGGTDIDSLGKAMRAEFENIDFDFRGVDKDALNQAALAEAMDSLTQMRKTLDADFKVPDVDEKALTLAAGGTDRTVDENALRAEMKTPGASLEAPDVDKKLLPAREEAVTTREKTVCVREKAVCDPRGGRGP